ncbi:hypothetical protein SERLADRAFT_472492 [Serpula lacrymans var. lacrymans S7.9]|uniref:DUF6534 domain-containing protein n=1 Tax=Serpula lacrymans var. lacrymans (strain S7.9) TaxID=578457 RepID=F8P3M7_SERL9|nr:uncharacterized protein SERLADRAFT_472492 [Serpula lacrymans var. lacrymans S7.9]EGO22126.1 hypothetical protein SERLADRAFT_472492 [Serpula lacrymans var. lacrymans S7.9]
MIFILARARAKIPNTPTETLISRMMMHSFQTGAATTVMAGIELALVIVEMAGIEIFWYDLPAFIMGKLYSNCLLALMNASKLPETSIGIASAPVSTLAFAGSGIPLHEDSFEIRLQNNHCAAPQRSLV